VNYSEALPRHKAQQEAGFEKSRGRREIARSNYKVNRRRRKTGSKKSDLFRQRIKTEP